MCVVDQIPAQDELNQVGRDQYTGAEFNRARADCSARCDDEARRQLFTPGNVDTP